MLLATPVPAPIWVFRALRQVKMSAVNNCLIFWQHWLNVEPNMAFVTQDRRPHSLHLQYSPNISLCIRDIFQLSVRVPVSCFIIFNYLYLLLWGIINCI